MAGIWEQPTPPRHVQVGLAAEHVVLVEGVSPFAVEIGRDLGQPANRQHQGVTRRVSASARPVAFGMAQTRADRPEARPEMEQDRGGLADLEFAIAQDGRTTSLRPWVIDR